MKQNKNDNTLIDYFKILLSDFWLLFCYCLRCVYYFLKKIFNYNFFIKSNSINNTKPEVLEFSELQEDQEDLVELPYIRNAVKDRAVTNFYAFLSFPHPTYLERYLENGLRKKEKKVFNYAHLYLSRLADGKLKSYNSKQFWLIKKDNKSIGGYFNVTTFKNYYYVMLNPKNHNPEITKFQQSAEEAEDFMLYGGSDFEKGLQTVANLANLNLTAKDNAFMITVLQPTTAYNTLNYRIRLNLFEKSLNYSLTDTFILIKNLTYKLSTLVELIMVKFGYCNHWFIKKNIPVQNVNENIFSDLVHNTQLNSLKKPNVVEPYEFFSDFDETFGRNLDFYFFNKLRLLKTYRCLDRDNLNYELRYKLFSKYYSSAFRSNYDQIVKNFIHYKKNNDKDLIVNFNLYTKNRPYILEFLTADLPSFLAYEGALYRDPTVRVVNNNSSFLSIADFLTIFYTNMFAEIKSAYSVEIKNKYSNYKFKKMNFFTLPTKFQRPTTPMLHMLKLKSHFTKLYNFNFVELNLKRPLIFDDTVADIDDDYQGSKYMFHYPLGSLFAYFDEDYTLVGDAMTKTAEHVQEIIKSNIYLEPDLTVYDPLITRLSKEHSDHLDIPLYFSTPFNMFEVRRYYDDPLQNQPPLVEEKEEYLAQLQNATQIELTDNLDAVLDLKLVNDFFNNLKKIDPIVYLKTAELFDEKKVRAVNYKKTISFNNNFEFPKITDEIFLFNLWPNLVTRIDPKKLNFSGFANFFIGCVLLHFFVTAFRVLLTFNNKQKLNKIFEGVYNTYLVFVIILAIIFFFLFFFFNLNGFFLITQHVLLAISVFKRQTVPKVQVDVDTVSEDPKLNFSLLRYKAFKNFYGKPSVSSVSNDNFLFNDENRDFGKSLYGLKFLKQNTATDIEVEFDDVIYNKRFKFFDASQFVIVVLNFSWANFYGLIFSIFFSLVIFKIKFDTISDKNKWLYLFLVMAFELLLVSGYYLSSTISLIQGFIVSGYWIFFLLLGVTLLYFVNKLK